MHAVNKAKVKAWRRQREVLAEAVIYLRERRCDNTANVVDDIVKDITLHIDVAEGRREAPRE